MRELYDKPFDGCKEVSYFGLRPLYYKPEKIKWEFGELETSVGYDDYICHLFMENTVSSEVYGYYTGLTSLNHIHGTSQVPVLVEICTNKVDKECNYSEGFGIRYRLYPSDILITKQNFMYLQLLSTVENLYEYFEDDVVQTVKYIVDKVSLLYSGFEEYLDKFSERTKGVIKDVFA